MAEKDLIVVKDSSARFDYTRDADVWGPQVSEPENQKRQRACASAGTRTRALACTNRDADQLGYAAFGDRNLFASNLG